MAAAVPAVLATIDESRGQAAARYLAGRLAQVRMQAATRSAAMAVRFVENADGVQLATYQDGNRDGVRTSQIEQGIDRPVDAPVRLADLFPGVMFEAPDGLSAIRLGGSNLLTFTPLGTATSGSVYVRSRNGTYFAVRVLGSTGRTRLQRFNAHLDDWIDGL